ncbi:MAG: hypothetical protein ACLGXA_18285 [Acidobacteriota bacterium]
MSRNTAKYLSYREAWRRINAAITDGYFFEAVTLCESIISDRLLSYVRGVSPSSKATIRTSFATLITEWRKLAGTFPVHQTTDLGEAIDRWRVGRNAVVHGMTKSMPDTATHELQSYMKRVEEAARSGAALARAVSNWHRRQLASYRNKNRVNDAPGDARAQFQSSRKEVSRNR